MAVSGGPSGGGLGDGIVSVIAWNKDLIRDIGVSILASIAGDDQPRPAALGARRDANGATASGATCVASAMSLGNAA